MSTNIILGGGIGGLSTAHYLSKIPNNLVKVFEASSRLGGWIHSVKNPNGILYELGPRTIRIAGEGGPNTLQLIEEINLSGKIRPVLSTQPAARNRLLYVDGKLCKLPNSLSSLFKTVPPFSKPLILSFLKDWKTPAPQLEDDSIYNFAKRRFGEEVAEYAASSIVCGVCAGDAKQISVNLLMEKWFRWEQESGGVVRGVLKAIKNLEAPLMGLYDSELSRRSKRERWNIWSLEDGLETLPETLGQVLEEKENVAIKIDSPCEKIEILSPTEVEVTIGGKKERGDHLFCCLPSSALSKILPMEHSPLKEELSAIPSVTVGIVNLAFEGNVLPVEGFGFLVPPCQKLPILGVIFDTCCFPQDGKTVLTVMMGGAWFVDLFGPSPGPEKLLEIALREVKRTLKIDASPIDSKVSVLKNCIPQHVIGHTARVERMREYIKEKKLPISLIGSSYDGVGINDVILSARRSVEKLMLKN